MVRRGAALRARGLLSAAGGLCARPALLMGTGAERFPALPWCPLASRLSGSAITANVWGQVILCGGGGVFCALGDA